MCVVLVFCVDDSTIRLVDDNIANSEYVYVMLMIYSWINLIGNLLIFSTIQKPNLCRQFFIQGFAGTLKPAPFTGTYFTRWQTKTILWLTAMNVFWVAGVTPTGTIAPDRKSVV